jgi:hypothetical protein
LQETGRRHPESSKSNRKGNLTRRSHAQPSIIGLNLAVVRPTTVQVTNCCFGVDKKTLRHNLLHKPALTEVIKIYLIYILLRIVK